MDYTCIISYRRADRTIANRVFVQNACDRNQAWSAALANARTVIDAAKWDKCELIGVWVITDDEPMPATVTDAIRADKTAAR